MSYWQSSQKERQIYAMRNKCMHDVLRYNKQQIEEKERKRYSQSKSFHEHSFKMNQQALAQLMEESNRNVKRREQAKQILKNNYDRQIRQKQLRSQEQKHRDVLFAQKQRQRMNYQEERRLLEFSRMFNRPTYRASLANNHRRTQTQPSQAEQAEHGPDPEQQFYTNPMKPKNLQSIDVNILPPPPQSNRNSAPRHAQRDSLDQLNYSFNKNQQHGKY